MNNFYAFGKDRYHQHPEMEKWCQENIGPGKWIGEPTPKNWQGLPKWTIHSMFGVTTFSFKDAKDYTLFLLKWS